MWIPAIRAAEHLVGEMPPELVLGAAQVGAYPLEPAYVCAYRTVGFRRSIYLAISSSRIRVHIHVHTV